MPTTLLKNPVEVSGTAAAATTASGAQPANILTVTGVAGQSTTGSTGQIAGAGSAVAITAGGGGAAPSGSTNGKGGNVTINPGAPGAGAGTASTYGNVLIATAGGRVGIGTTAPNASVEISGSQRTFTATRIGDGGSGGGVSWTCRKANPGTTSVAEGDEISIFTYSGHDGASYILGARVRTIVDGPVSTGQVPMALAFSTGSGVASEPDDPEAEARPEARADKLQAGAVLERMRLSSAGNVGIATSTPGSKLHVIGCIQVGTPTGGDMGNGNINIQGDIYQNGQAYTHPDYVFAQHFAGSNDAGYAGPVPLANLEETIKAHGQLPGIGREPLGMFGRQDALLEKLEEAYLYIIELTRRVDRLEARLAETGKERA